MEKLKEQPRPGQYIFIREKCTWTPAECFRDSTGLLYALIPGDLQQTKHPVIDWLPLPPPTENWIKWAEQGPPTGDYVYIRDPAYPQDFELALIIGDPGNVRAVLPIDPFSHHEEQEWQPLKPGRF